MKNLYIPIKYGLAIGTALIAYFLILSLFGAHTNPIYSLLNGVIAGYGIYEGIKHYKLLKGEKFKYQKGFAAGMLSGFNATILFSVFMGIYASHLNPAFLDNIQWRLTGETGLGLFLFEVIIMGFATSVVLTLSFMQLFKKSWNTKDGKRHTYNKEEKK